MRLYEGNKVFVVWKWRCDNMVPAGNIEESYIASNSDDTLSVPEEEEEAVNVSTTREHTVTFKCIRCYP